MESIEVTETRVEVLVALQAALEVVASSLIEHHSTDAEGLTAVRPSVGCSYMLRVHVTDDELQVQLAEHRGSWSLLLDIASLLDGPERAQLLADLVKRLWKCM